MQVINIHEAKTHFSQILTRVENGEEVIIGRAGKPIAKLVIYHAKIKDRKPGYWQGKVNIHDDFDELP
jgi:prevent-host-death family protein